MCGKQCRDENGFKCHLSSESHKRQMMVFGENPDRVVQGYSEEFENTFMEHLRRSHPYSRVSAKNVYNEYIADRHHIHMNSTHWLTLTDFVQHLGKKGLCKVCCACVPPCLEAFEGVRTSWELLARNLSGTICESAINMKIIIEMGRQHSVALAFDAFRGSCS